MITIKGITTLILGKEIIESNFTPPNKNKYTSGKIVAPIIIVLK